MITQDDKLQIFENFRTDPSLPKHASKERDAMVTLFQKRVGGFGVLNSPSVFREGWEGVEEADMMATESFGSVMVQEKDPPKRPWWAFWRGKPRKEEEPAPTMTVEEFFSSVKNSSEELVIVKERAAGYEKALLNAKNCGQVALAERLSAGLNAFRAEAQLIAMGLPKYVREDTIVRFYKESPKGLRLDWLINFVRVVPDSVIAKKRRADELGIFDNYVVLHYDPKGKGVAKTQKELEAEAAAKRDPILFGIIAHRRQLYVVGDWVDEFCDLTLDQFAELMGKDAVQDLTDVTAKPYRG